MTILPATVQPGMLMLAAAIALAGCGGAEAPTQTAPAAGGAAARATSQAGSAALDGQAAEVARSLPAFAPLYPGATVVSTLDAQGSSGAAQMVTLETRDSLDKVLDFYDSRIAEAGGEATLRTQTAESGTRAVRMADGSGGMVTASSDGETTTIGIVHGQQM